MGNAEVRHKLWTAITANDPETVRKILLRYPQFINEPISDDQKTNAVTRAAYLDRPHILAELVTHGADLNKVAGSGISALMWAAARGNLECVRFLINFGADTSQQGPFGLTAADYAILYGYYNTAYFLYTNGILPTKSAQEFEEIRAQMQTLYVDFPCILMSLERSIPPDVVPFFTIPPIKREVEIVDPVRDPNESWTDWANRLLEFEKPPLVERNSLPQALQPQNTLIGKIKIKLNLENPPPILAEFNLDRTDSRKIVNYDENQAKN